jgi:hypothetical protein
LKWLQTDIREVKLMDRKAEQAGHRKTVVILSDRSREIIRLFEERQRKRLQDGQNRQQSSAPFKPPSESPPQSS